MCGRVVIASSPEEFAEYLGATAIAETLAGPDHNLAPSRQLPLVWDSGSDRTLGLARWGLVPSWAPDASFGERTFNARAETVAVKPSFRAAVKRRRCLVPVDGYYEWAAGTPKQPWFIHGSDARPLALAGLWETWDDPASPHDQPVRSCTVITVPASDDVAAVHHRMPAVLAPDAWATWLDPGIEERDLIEPMLLPAPAGTLARHPVDRRVGNARIKGADLVDPVTPDGAALPGPGQESLW